MQLPPPVDAANARATLRKVDAANLVPVPGSTTLQGFGSVSGVWSQLRNNLISLFVYEVNLEKEEVPHSCLVLTF